MLEKPPHGLFITGTDTGVGKTHVTCALARWLQHAGQPVGVFKPAESGFDETRLSQTDAWKLWDAAGRPRDWTDVCPQRFAAPLAPDQAARVEGRLLDEEKLRTGLAVWRYVADTVLVEAAGGMMSPVGERDLVLDLALEFGYPLVIVVDNSIGAINRALQAAWVARTFRGGQPVAGFVLSQTSAQPDPSRTSNAAEIRARSEIPVLAEFPFDHDAADFDFAALKRWLPIQPLP